MTLAGWSNLIDRVVWILAVRRRITNGIVTVIAANDPETWR